jgi:SAM-dependent methyltransferase
MEREVQQQFGAVASNYIASAVHARGIDLPILIEAIEPGGHEHVLDLGTAVGHTAFALAPHVREVIGLDLTTEMLGHARRLAGERGHTNASFARADVTHLPIADSSFDVVTSRFSAHHYARPDLVVREIARVLKPGGRFVLVDTIAPEDSALDTFINAIELLRDRSHVRDHTIAQWQSMLAAVGLVSEVIFTWDLALDVADWLARMQTPPQAAAMIETLLAEAPPAAREAFHVDRSGAKSFCLKAAIIRARHAGPR